MRTTLPNDVENSTGFGIRNGNLCSSPSSITKEQQHSKPNNYYFPFLLYIQDNTQATQLKV